jgi:hypothetical protein
LRATSQTEWVGWERFGGTSKCGEEVLVVARKKEEAREQLQQAMAEKVAVDEASAHAKPHAKLAEQEPASARQMRRQSCLSHREQDDEEMKGSADTWAPHGRFHVKC